MVHPNVLQELRPRPGRLAGLRLRPAASTAWAVLKYGMPDLRDMFASDVRWLDHYGFSRLRRAEPRHGAELMDVTQAWRHELRLRDTRLADELLGLVLTGKKTATCWPTDGLKGWPRARATSPRAAVGR